MDILLFSFAHTNGVLPINTDDNHGWQHMQLNQHFLNVAGNDVPDPDPNPNPKPRPSSK